MNFQHARRHDHDHLTRAQRAEMSQRAASEETLVPDQVIESLLSCVRTMAYAEKPKAWYQEQKQLMMILTWPASWLNERAVGLPLDRYQDIMTEILNGIQSHGELGKMHHFPAYLSKCVRSWFIHNGEALYAERKSLRNAIDLRLIKGIGSAPKKSGPDPIEALAMAHKVLAQGGRTAKTLKHEDREQTLFGF